MKRVQLTNYSERHLAFELSWPAHARPRNLWYCVVLWVKENVSNLIGVVHPREVDYETPES